MRDAPTAEDEARIRKAAVRWLLAALELTNRVAATRPVEAFTCRQAGMEFVGGAWYPGRSTYQWIVDQRWPCPERDKLLALEVTTGNCRA